MSTMTFSARSVNHTAAGTFVAFPSRITRARAEPRIVSVPKDELYYWSSMWQTNERAALADLAAGRFTDYGADEDAAAWLDED